MREPAHPPNPLQKTTRFHLQIARNDTAAPRSPTKPAPPKKRPGGVMGAVLGAVEGVAPNSDLLNARQDRAKEAADYTEDKILNSEDTQMAADFVEAGVNIVTLGEGAMLLRGGGRLLLSLIRAGTKSKAGVGLVARTACFAGGTLVATEDGLRPIETVAVGDLVWARDEETGEEAWKPVLQVIATPDKQVLELTFEAGDRRSQTLSVTTDHPIWSLDDEAWEEAGLLVLGESVDALGGPMRLVRAVEAPDRQTVYNFEVGEGKCSPCPVMT